MWSSLTRSHHQRNHGKNSKELAVHPEHCQLGPHQVHGGGAQHWRKLGIPLQVLFPVIARKIWVWRGVSRGKQFWARTSLSRWIQAFATENLDLYYDTVTQWPRVYGDNSNLTSCKEKESVLQVMLNTNMFFPLENLVIRERSSIMSAGFLHLWVPTLHQQVLTIWW